MENNFVNHKTLQMLAMCQKAEEAVYYKQLILVHGT